MTTQQNSKLKQVVCNALLCKSRILNRAFNHQSQSSVSLTDLIDIISSSHCCCLSALFCIAKTLSLTKMCSNVGSLLQRPDWARTDCNKQRKNRANWIGVKGLSENLICRRHQGTMSTNQARVTRWVKSQQHRLELWQEDLFNGGEENQHPRALTSSADGGDVVNRHRLQTGFYLWA